MNRPSQKPGVLRFGTFELEFASSELRKGGALVKLQSQHFQLLALLVERAGQVVSREEIRRALWDNETFVDFDRSINFCVNQIRGALDDDPQSPRFIETLPRKGYRFIAPVTETGDEPAEAEPAAVPARRWRLLSACALVALVAIALAAKMVLSRQPGAKPIESLAVLPLENLSHDPEQDYFAEGMTDELITDLAKIGALRVISRTSVMQYKGTKKPIPQIARELNVDAVLEGTVTRDQGRVRITAQLIAAEPEKHLWAEKYEGSLSEVLNLQDAVAKAVAHEIQIKVTPRERTLLDAPRAVNTESYEAYLKGRYFHERESEENLQKCKEYFQQAIEKDPGYALAWAGLAESYALLAACGVSPRAETYPRARAAAEKAVELDHNLAEPLVTLARVKTEYEWDWAGAERLYKRAIGLNPNYGAAHQNYAVHLAEVGRRLEAVAEARRAHEAEPLSLHWDINVGLLHYLAREYGQAERECAGVIQVDPGRSFAHVCLGSAYLLTGRQQQAIAELRQAAVLSKRSVLELMYLGHALGVSGARAEARKVLDEMKGLSLQRYVPPDCIAVVYEGLGERDQALQWFEKAYAERSMHAWILPDPRLDSIRTEPRFKNLMRRMGLPQ